jgi:hypothetical protein
MGMAMKIGQMARGQHTTQGTASDNALGTGGSLGHLNETLRLGVPISAQLVAVAFDPDQAPVAWVLHTA